MAAVLVLNGPVTVTIAEALDALGWTVTDLATKAGVSASTVIRAMVPGDEYKTNVTSAEALAWALGLSVNQVEWANGISTLGRPAETGVPTGKVFKRRDNTICPVHYITLPNSNLCDMCS